MDTTPTTQPMTVIVVVSRNVLPVTLAAGSLDAADMVDIQFQKGEVWETVDTLTSTVTAKSVVSPGNFRLLKGTTINEVSLHVDGVDDKRVTVTEGLP